METIGHIQECRYNLDGEIFFKTATKRYSINQNDALEIAFALVDSLGLPYNILEDVEIKVHCDD